MHTTTWTVSAAIAAVLLSVAPAEQEYGQTPAQREGLTPTSSTRISDDALPPGAEAPAAYDVSHEHGTVQMKSDASSESREARAARALRESDERLMEASHGGS